MRFPRLVINSVKRFFGNQSLFPFETMWAFFCIYAGVAAILSYGVTVGPLARALGPVVAMIFNVAFVVAGLGMYFGIGLKRGNLEAFGLFLLAMSLAVRTVVNGWLFGWNAQVINGYVLNAAFVFSCVVRLRTIYRWPKGVTEIMEGK